MFFSSSSNGAASTSSTASTSDLLPDLLEFTLHLHDAVRCTGDTLAGTICISIPTRRSLQVLHGIDESMLTSSTSASSSASVTPSATPSTPSTRRLLNGNSQNGASSSSSQNLLSPLSHPFSFQLKFQLVGRVLYDTQRFDARSLLRFKPTHLGGATTKQQGSFKLWSTRIITLDIPVTSSFPLSHEFRVALPYDLPPTYRGTAMSIQYFMHAIATLPVVSGMSASKKIIDFKQPFRVRGNISSSSFSSNSSKHIIEMPSNLVSNIQYCLVDHSVDECITEDMQRQREDDRGESEEEGGTSSDGGSSNNSMQTRFANAIAAAMAESDQANGVATAAAAPAKLPSVPSATISHINGSSISAASSASTTASTTAATPTTSSSSSSTTLPPAHSLRRRDSSSMLSPPHDINDDSPLMFHISKTVNAPSVPTSSPSTPSNAAVVSPATTEINLHVVKLTLDQRFLRPGDTLRGHLDFSRSQIRCYRVIIELLQEERIEEDVANLSSNGKTSKNALSTTSTKLYSTYHAYTVNTLSTHFLFSLPSEIVENFRTDLLTVQWQLAFTFVTDVDAPMTTAPIATSGAATQNQNSSAVPPKSTTNWSFLPTPSITEAEPLRWSMPLQVLPHDDSEVMKQRLVKTVLFSPQSTV